MKEKGSGIPYNPSRKKGSRKRLCAGRKDLSFFGEIYNALQGEER